MNPKAKIKDVYIQLKDYKFLHTAYKIESKELNNRYIARHLVRDRIKTLLLKSSSESGTYLITGFRGMGKTSEIRRAISEINKEVNENKTGKIDLNLFLRPLKRFLALTILFTLFQYAYTHIQDYCVTFFNFNPYILWCYPLFLLSYLILSIGLIDDSLSKNKILPTEDISQTPRIILSLKAKILRGILIFSILSMPLINYLFFDINNYNSITSFNTFILLSILNIFSVILYFIISILFIVLLIKSSIKRIKPDLTILQAFWSIIKLITIIISIVFTLLYLTKLSSIFNNYIRQGSLLKYIIIFIVCVIVIFVLLSLVLFINDFLFLFHSRIAQSNYIKQRNSNTGNTNNTLYYLLEINLSQDTLTEKDILKRLTEKILDYWKRHENEISTSQFHRPIYKPWIFLLNLMSTGKVRNQSQYHEILTLCQTLINRISGSVSISKEINNNPDIAAEFTKHFAKLTMPLSRSINTNTINYPIATSKEAEDELLKILEQISNYRKNVDIPNFVFIIDEIDKIEPQNNYYIDEKEFSNPAFDNSVNAPGSRQFRKRQEAVANLLSNLKGFLNSANAKFFFIGGRELFDADLADISDRDSFYSSIFSDVIYIESFYKDKLKDAFKEGVTHVIEGFLMNLIVQHSSILYKSDGSKEFVEEGHLTLKYLFDHLSHDIDLKSFRLNKEITENKESKEGIENKGNNEEDTIRQKIKLLTLLQNYIIYLSYRSNGSPKKLTNLIENIIVNRTVDENLFENNLVVLDKDCVKGDNTTFLKFSFNTQYEITVTSSIYLPYLINQNTNLKAYGDKLLFSTPFIFDNIIKFYPFGFSWRNLEHIPEVILVNKEPHLREHIQNILEYLCKSFIKETVSGLYDYKFHSLVKKELSILSKTSELSSAAFNFTLDESLLVKRHYKKKLIELREKYQNYQPVLNDNQFVHSLYFVQTILGNLYFYDKEYDEAILYFTESIQTLRIPNAIAEQKITRHQFYLWLINKLRIGLTLEKIRAYDSAVSYYRTLIVESRKHLKQMQFSELGNVNLSGNESEISRTSYYILLPFVSILAALEKSRVDGIDYFNLIQNMWEFNEVIKRAPRDVMVDDINIDSYRRGFLWSDYFNNVGSILYYKNCQFTRFFSNNVWKKHPSDISEHLLIVNGGNKVGNSENIYPPENEESFKYLYENFDIRYYLQALDNTILDSFNTQYNKVIMEFSGRKYDYFPSITSIVYYLEALNCLTSYHEKRILYVFQERGTNIDTKINCIHIAAFYLLPEFVDMINASRFYYIANVVSKLADALLASLSKIDNEDCVEVLKGINELVILLDDKHDKYDHKKLIDKIMGNFKLEGSLFTFKNVLYIMVLAGELYKKSGHSYYYSFTLKKILYTLKEYLSTWCKENNKKLSLDIIDLVEMFSIKIIKSSSWHNDITNRPQILKYRDILQLFDLEDYKTNIALYASIINNSDIREAVLITETIKLQTLDLREFEPKFKLSCFDKVNNKYIRLLELKYNLELVYIEFQKFVNTGKGNDLFNINYTFLEMEEERISKLEDFLIEAFFSLYEAAIIVQLYDPGFIITYAYLAEIFKRTGDWSIVLFNLKTKIYSNKEKMIEKLNKRLIDTLGHNNKYYNEPNYHYELAIHNYYKVLQLHTEGKAYKDKVLNIFYLEDDYNDNLSHFNIATERLLVNLGKIRERIDWLNIKTQNSKFYIYKNYA
ncbi:MAG: hypothetical protein WBP41_21030 [Saprospiraceae bacterium]